MEQTEDKNGPIRRSSFKQEHKEHINIANKSMSRISSPEDIRFTWLTSTKSFENITEDNQTRLLPLRN
jgi:hypothetical protein